MTQFFQFHVPPQGRGGQGNNPFAGGTNGGQQQQQNNGDGDANGKRPPMILNDPSLLISKEASDGPCPDADIDKTEVFLPQLGGFMPYRTVFMQGTAS
jgi:hypothetical protein